MRYGDERLSFVESMSHSIYRSTAACSIQYFQKAFCESIDTAVVDSRSSFIEQLSDIGGFRTELEAVLFRT